MRIGIAGVAVLFVISIAATVGNAAGDDLPKLLSGDDLSTEPYKWDGKMIEAVGQCFFAQNAQYWCAIPGSQYIAKIDLTNIQPPEIKKAIQTNCDTFEKGATRACRFKVEFEYGFYFLHDVGGGESFAEIIPAGSAGKLSRSK